METIENETLLRNLEAISTISEILETRIRWPIDSSHLAFDQSQNPIYKHHQSWLSFEARHETISSACKNIGSFPFLFGIGNGEYIRYIFQSYQPSRVTVWERDPALLRFVLMQHDFSAEISSGKLKFFLGADLVIQRLNFEFSDIIYHPFFSEIYHHECRVVESENKECFAALGLGDLFVDDLAETLSQKGFQIWPVDLQKWSKEELRYTMACINPEFLATINYTNGTAEFCENLQIPFLCWEIDPNMDVDITLQSTTQQSYIFTYRKKNVSLFKNAGFIHVAHLPLASNTDKRTPVQLTEEDQKKYCVPVAFVGRSMVSEAKFYRQEFVKLYLHYKNFAAEAKAECEQSIQNIMDEQLKNGSHYIIPEMFTETFSEFARYLRNKKVHINPEKILAQIASAERRLHYIAALGDLGTQVWGDKGWSPVEDFGAKYVGYAGHHHELTRIYSGAAINIDINRIYQLDIVTMRVFDVLSCGGFLIAEHSEELGELFAVGEELESYTTLAEARDKIKYYMKYPDLRRKIALRGMEAVRKKHNFSQRLDYMLQVKESSCNLQVSK